MGAQLTKMCWLSLKKTHSITVNNWLVVLTILKNISQWEGLSHILWKNMSETTSQIMLADHQLIRWYRSSWYSSIDRTNDTCILTLLTGLLKYTSGDT